ncbi:hypothetical protein RRG08_063339 [Elysia crispata]|uniref:C-type lectin domain-containing protein n=1 Tax=Elysia crispata TaxID=231223 RepID=A0AAE1EA10_9GAST|nr:hypothetical protein RRG08_063339 [Elysia crispata]
MSSYYFTVNNDAECIKAQLSPPWTAKNEFTCIAECKSRFQDRCRNVLFNNQSLACTPVHPMSRDDPSPGFQPGDILFSEDMTRYLACDTAAGFKVYQECGQAVCALQSSVKATYSNAKAACQAQNATVYSPNTYERFGLLNTLMSENSINNWIGLTRVDISWVWETGDVVQPEFASFMWGVGQPNLNPGDFCTLKLYGVQKLHDSKCINEYRYVCEQRQSTSHKQELQTSN